MALPVSIAADTILSTDDDSGWQTSDSVNSLDFECVVTALTLPEGDEAVMSQPNVSVYIEGQYADQDVVELWQGVFYEPTTEHTSIGPGLEVDRPVPETVRVRWTLNGGTATLGMTLTGITEH